MGQFNNPTYYEENTKGNRETICVCVCVCVGGGGGGRQHWRTVLAR